MIKEPGQPHHFPHYKCTAGHCFVVSVCRELSHNQIKDLPSFYDCSALQEMWAFKDTYRCVYSDVNISLSLSLSLSLSYSCLFLHFVWIYVALHLGSDLCTHVWKCFCVCLSDCVSFMFAAGYSITRSEGLNQAHSNSWFLYGLCESMSFDLMIPCMFSLSQDSYFICAWCKRLQVHRYMHTFNGSMNNLFYNARQLPGTLVWHAGNMINRLSINVILNIHDPILTSFGSQCT